MKVLFLVFIFLFFASTGEALTLLDAYSRLGLTPGAPLEMVTKNYYERMKVATTETEVNQLIDSYSMIQAIFEVAKNNEIPVSDLVQRTIESDKIEQLMQFNLKEKFENYILNNHSTENNIETILAIYQDEINKLHENYAYDMSDELKKRIYKTASTFKQDLTKISHGNKTELYSALSIYADYLDEIQMRFNLKKQALNQEFVKLWNIVIEQDQYSISNLQAIVGKSSEQIEVFQTVIERFKKQERIEFKSVEAFTKYFQMLKQVERQARKTNSNSSLAFIFMNSEKIVIDGKAIKSKELMNTIIELGLFDVADLQQVFETYVALIESTSVDFELVRLFRNQDINLKSSHFLSMENSLMKTYKKTYKYKSSDLKNRLNLWFNLISPRKCSWFLFK